MTGAIFGNQVQALAAYEEAGIDPPHLFEHFEIHHGFQYTRQSPYAGEQLARFVAKSRALASKHGGACNVWEGFSLPREVLPTLGVVADGDIYLPLPLAANAATVRTREDYNIIARLKPVEAGP